ncbi:MAG: hypothetical protein KGI64_06290 [Xanthomonadaceae bacterium]|nr:hypothetical protein [Xanthomonadaceae bacterium]MDE1885163.1 hypothetical protein [Xanthomonadaceae bacterium]MDE1962067.1 hypothetical protein [Xanthomonadaceae bacterium]MDE2084453.1 hypothetical protein [Xanthomonadaceae bacterium]MDE2257301.1 hypothetical protein [Xanthomonadaceae bacterium]
MACDLSALSNLDPTDPEAAQRLLDQCTAALTDPSLWIWAIVFTVVCAAVGALIGKYKNAVARDALLGAALGPIGWIISLLLPAHKPAPKCAACGKTVDAGDKHCRHCGARL